MRTTFTVPEPFSLRAMYDSHGWLWTHPFHPDPESGSIVRLERIGRKPVHIRVSEGKHRDGRVPLVVQADAPDRDRPVVRATVTKMLGLDEDLTAFYALAKADPRLAPLLHHGAGRTARGTSLFEDCIKGIAQTNIQWKQAIVCINRIVTLGTKHKASGLHAFPTPKEILDAGADWLRDNARVGYRADAIVHLADEVETGQRDLGSLESRAATLSTDALVKELKTIRGIGPATAHTLAGFLRKHDVISVDSATLAYVQHHYPRAFKGARPTTKEAAAVFDRYGAWKGKAWWYEAWLTRHVIGNPARKNQP